MSATDYLEQQIINTHLRSQATHVALCTADPTDTGANEVTLAAFQAYARQAADAGGLAGSGWTDPATSGQTTNTNKLTFPAFDGALDLTITHWIVFDAGGNPLVYAPLQSPRTLRQGDRLIFDPAALTVTIT